MSTKKAMNQQLKSLQKASLFTVGLFHPVAEQIYMAIAILLHIRGNIFIPSKDTPLNLIARQDVFVGRETCSLLKILFLA